MSINEEIAKKLEQEYATLMETANTQLNEWKKAMKVELNAWLDKNPDPRWHRLQLLAEIGEIKIINVTVRDLEENRNEKGLITVPKHFMQIVYDMADHIHDFMCQPFIPEVLNLTKQGGITLDERAHVSKA